MIGSNVTAILMKSNERTLVSEFAILAQKFKKNCCTKKRVDFGSLQLIMMGLGQEQQRHPAVHTGGVSRGGSKAVAVGVSDM